MKAYARSIRRLLNVLLHWVPMMLWMGWIFWLSDQPKLPHPARKVGLSDYLFDYMAHAFTFGVLTALVWWASVPYYRCLPEFLPPEAFSGIFAALYAVSDELHQMFVPGRWAKFSDWLADVAGILFVVGLITWIRRFLWPRRLVRLPWLAKLG